WLVRRRAEREFLPAWQAVQSGGDVDVDEAGRPERFAAPCPHHKSIDAAARVPHRARRLVHGRVAGRAHRADGEQAAQTTGSAMTRQRAPSNFRQQDVARAVRAVKGSGLDIARVEVDPKTSKIVLVVKGDDTNTKIEVNP